MAANSLPRRIAKRLLAPLLNERTYSLVQAVAMSWDIWRRTWYEPELELLPFAIRPNETALDIGANYGLYAYYLSRVVGPHGRVYCFEPIPFTVRTLRTISRLLRFRHNVDIVAKGCGEKAGLIPFTLPLLDSGAISAGLVNMGRNDARPGREMHAQFNRTTTVTCEVVTVDEFLPDIPQLALIKCDIEGADLFAMRGASRTIAQHKPSVIIEINPWFLEGFGLRVANIFEFFEALDYQCYKYESETLRRVRAADIVEDNWIFLHPCRLDRFAALIAPTA